VAQLGQLPQETGPIGGGKIPIAPTVDANTFPELAQRPTASTDVVLDGAPEERIQFRIPMELKLLLTPMLTLKTPTV
jgi:hypothetical protein